MVSTRYVQCGILLLVLYMYRIVCVTFYAFASPGWNQACGMVWLVAPVAVVFALSPSDHVIISVVGDAFAWLWLGIQFYILFTLPGSIHAAYVRERNIDVRWTLADISRVSAYEWLTTHPKCAMKRDRRVRLRQK